MADWSFPQISVSGNDLSVDVVNPDFSVDVTDINSSDILEDIKYVSDSGVSLDVSGGDITGVHMSADYFKDFVQSTLPVPSVSEDDLSFDQNFLVVEGNDVSFSSFNPQSWQVNMAQNRPIGWHYVMSRAGNNNYILVLGRDITYSDGLYTYSDAEFYSVYSTGSSGSTRYHYDVYDNYSGSLSSTSYVVYSDLYFDYLGSRSVTYSWFIFAFIALLLLFLLFFRRNKS